jgi:hypothetical protein
LWGQLSAIGTIGLAPMILVGADRAEVAPNFRS